MMSSPEISRRALVVVGMHRSGTSAITGVFNHLGAALPTNLAPIAPENAKEGEDASYFEGAEINAINDEFLAAVGSSWNDAARIPDEVFRSEVATYTRSRIVESLDADFGRKPLFVLKDPRIARLLPLWTDALRIFGAEANFVLTFRNPVEVALSLERRDGIGRGQSALLWLRHMLEAERQTRNHRRSFVSYQALLENWRSVARRVASDCGFHWPRFNAEAELDIDRFLSPARRHNVAKAAQLLELPEWMRKTYTALEEAGVDNCFDTPVTDEVLGELDRADGAFNLYVRELIRDTTVYMSQTKALADQLDSERARTQTLAEEITALSQKETELLAALQRETELLANAREGRERAQAELDSIRLSLDEARRHAEALDQQASAEAAAYEGIKADLSRSRSALAAADQALASSEAVRIAADERAEALVVKLRLLEASHNEAVNSLGALRIAAEERAEALEVKLRLSDARNSAAVREVETLQADCTTLQSRVLEIEHQKRTEAQRYQQTIDGYQTEIRRKDEVLAEWQATAADLRKVALMAPSLRVRVDELNTDNDSLKLDLRNAARDLEHLRSASADVEGTVQSFAAALQFSSITIRRLSAERQLLSDDKEDLQTRLDLEKAKRLEGDAARVALAETLANANTSLALLQGSKSWLLTKPLRFLSRRLQAMADRWKRVTKGLSR